MNRVTEIRHVIYGVTGWEAERAFYSGPWGLREVSASADRVWFAAAGSEEPCVVGLHRAAVNHLEVIALAAPDRDSIENLHERVLAANCRVLHAPRTLSGPFGGYGFRCFSPDGLPLEISCDVARGPQRDVERWEGIPLGISHIVLHSPQPLQAVRFFTEALGFRISDWLGDFMCFLRCNSAHHRLAILPGPPCLNHVAYDMRGIDGMMRGIARLHRAGIEVRWGPGRHTAGDNTFSYFVTPGGFTVEYTAELERVDFETHQSTVYAPAPQIMDQWGIGTGGPQSLPHPAPDPCLFQGPQD